MNENSDKIDYETFSQIRKTSFLKIYGVGIIQATFTAIYLDRLSIISLTPPFLLRGVDTYSAGNAYLFRHLFNNIFKYDYYRYTNKNNTYQIFKNELKTAIFCGILNGYYSNMRLRMYNAENLQEFFESFYYIIKQNRKHKIEGAYRVFYGSLHIMLLNFTIYRVTSWCTYFSALSFFNIEQNNYFAKIFFSTISNTLAAIVSIPTTEFCAYSNDPPYKFTYIYFKKMQQAPIFSLQTLMKYRYYVMKNILCLFIFDSLFLI